MLAFSIHETRYANSPDTDNKPIVQHAAHSWTQLVDAVFSDVFIQADKHTVPCFVPVKWRELTRGKSKPHVESVHFLGLDIDKDLTHDALQRLKERLKPYSHIIYPTHSCYAHNKATGDYKVRVIIPLSHTIPTKAWGAFWEKAKVFFGDWVIDPACKNANRLYYLPAAPSREAHAWMVPHISGEVDAPPLDVALINAVKAPNRTASSAAADGVPLAVIEETLQRVATNMQKGRKHHALGSALTALLRGVSYSVEGARHDVMVQLAWVIAGEYPHRNAEDLAQLFERSHEYMEEQHATPPDSTAHVIECIRSAQAKIADNLAELEAYTRSRAADDNERAAGVADPDYVYTDKDRAEIAEKIGVAAQDDIWIVMSPASKEIYFVTKKGLVGFLNTPENVAHHLGLLRPTGIQTHNVRGPKDAPRYALKALKELTDKNTRVLEMVRYDNRIAQDTLNGAVLMRPCPKSNLPPVFSDIVDGYLRALFGDDYPKAQDWLAWFPDTERLACALFLSGPGSIGKTLLATGLARIWKHGHPVTFDHAVSNFNFDITKSPFIFADEGMPQVPGIAEHLRKFTGNYSFKVERKFGDTAESLGARRVMIATNNTQALNFKSNVLEKNDLDALQERIWICRGRAAGREYLEKMSFETHKAMADCDIAKHVLWLSENCRPASAKGRFAVSGSAEISSELVLADGPSRKIFTILQQIMDDAAAGGRNGRTLHATGWGNGHLYISGPDIKNEWSHHDWKEEKWTQPGKHLQKIGTATVATFKGKKTKTCRVNAEHFYAFLEQSAGVDSEPYRAMVEGTAG